MGLNLKFSFPVPKPSLRDLHHMVARKRQWPGQAPAMMHPCAGVSRYCDTVCTTLEIGRALVVGTFSSLSSASSYSGSVWNDVLALICTTL